MATRATSPSSGAVPSNASNMSLAKGVPYLGALVMVGAGVALLLVTLVIYLIKLDSYRELAAFQHTGLILFAVGGVLIGTGFFLSRWAQNKMMEASPKKRSMVKGRGSGEKDDTDDLLKVQVRCSRCRSFNNEGDEKCRLCGAEL